MATLWLTRGIPGSGKTTFAKAWVANDPDRRVRVNRDDLRTMLFGADYGKPQQDKEDLLTKVQQETVLAWLKADYDVIVDDMHLRSKYVKQWHDLWNAIVVQDFRVDAETAVFRDAERQARGERYVGAELIRDLYQRFTPKGKFSPLPVFEKDGVGDFPLYVEPEFAPRAILVDIDGTLAHMTGRGPYEFERVGEDEYDKVIGDLAAHYYGDGAHVIIMSGRGEEYRDITEQWLRDKGKVYDALYMRAAGDTRKDDVVKNELFEKHIAGRYKVLFILDDRDRVVKMWRAKGLKVLQVADGNF